MILFYSRSDPLPEGLRMELQSVVGGAGERGERGVALWVDAAFVAVIG